MRLTSIQKIATLILSLQMMAGVASSEEPGEGLGRGQAFVDGVRKSELATLEAYLQSRGVAMTREGIRKFLLEQTESKVDRALVEKMILQLGADDFFERTRAAESLSQLPVPPFDLLREAVRSPDPEVAFQAKRILEGAASRRWQSVETAKFAIRAIELLKLSGLTREMFRAAGYFQNESLLASIQPALLATATAEDLPLLESLIDKKPILRTIAIRALGAEGLAGVGGVRDRLDALWNTGQPADRLASTEALLARGEREALGRLVTLLESDDAGIRARAASRLFLASGQLPLFDANGPAEERAKQVAAWRRWVAVSGVTTEMRTGLVYSYTWGLTLVSNFLSDCVVEYDLAGNETWRVELEDPWACWGIETGERFVHAYGKFYAYASGQGPPRVLWRMEDVNEVCPLPFGETLLWSIKDGTLRQVDRAGKLIWEAEVKWEGKKRRVTDIQRLPSGKTLVAIKTTNKSGPVYGDTVLELDRGGRVVRHFPYDRKVETLQHFPNGNRLVRLNPDHPDIGSFIEERDPAGKVVWSYDSQIVLRSAHRLPNGNTLLGGNPQLGGNGLKAGIKEIRLDGSIAWKLNGGERDCHGISMVYRY